VALRHYLDGRRPAPLLTELKVPEATAIGRLVHHLRHLAFQQLKPPRPDHYVLGDYFHGLYFTLFAMLRHQAVCDDVVPVRLIVVAAALTLGVLLDLGHCYSRAPSAPCRRPWECPPDLG